MEELQAFRTKWRDILTQVVEQKYLSGQSDFLNEMQEVHIKIFGAKFVSNCASCIIEAARRIKNHI